MGLGSRRGALNVNGANRFGSDGIAQAFFDEFMRQKGVAPTDPVTREFARATAEAVARTSDYLGGTVYRGETAPDLGLGWNGDFYLQVVYTTPYPDPPTTANIYGPKTNDGWGNPIPFGGGGPGVGPLTIVTKSASWTFDATLADTAYVLADSASALTATVPANSVVPFPIGTVLQGCQQNTGQLTVAPDTGVTIHTAETLLMRKRYSSFALLKVATNGWNLTGDLELA